MFKKRKADLWLSIPALSSDGITSPWLGTWQSAGHHSAIGRSQAANVGRHNKHVGIVLRRKRSEARYLGCARGHQHFLEKICAERMGGLTTPESLESNPRASAQGDY